MPSDPSKRLQLIVDEKWKKRVKAWASKQSGKPNLSEAIRRLVDTALEAERKKK